MTIDLFILMLVAFMLVAALIAVEARDLLSAVIALGAAGFALSVVDLLLGAPDLAFPQVLVEVITLVLLIRMIMTRQDTSRQTPRDTLRTGVVMLAGGIFLVAAFLAAGGFAQGGAIPRFGRPLLADPAERVAEEVFLEYNRFGLPHDNRWGFVPIRCIRTGRYKLVLNLLDRDELYDLAEDPGEITNRIDDPALEEVRNRLHDRLLEWMDDRLDPLRGQGWWARPWRPGHDLDPAGRRPDLHRMA